MQSIYCCGVAGKQTLESDCSLPCPVQALFSHFLGTLQAACTPVQLGTGADYRRIHPGSQVRHGFIPKLQIA